MLGGFIGSWHGLMAPILLPDIPCLNFRWSLPVCGEKWKRALGMDISTCWKQWYQWESRWAEHTKQNATIRNPHERWISVIDHIKKACLVEITLLNMRRSLNPRSPRHDTITNMYLSIVTWIVEVWRAQSMTLWGGGMISVHLWTQTSTEIYIWTENNGITGCRYPICANIPNSELLPYIHPLPILFSFPVTSRRPELRGDLWSDSVRSRWSELTTSRKSRLLILRKVLALIRSSLCCERILRLSATTTGWTFATILVRRGCTGSRGRASSNSEAIFFVETGGCNGFFTVSGVTTTLSAGFLASAVVSVVALLVSFCGVGVVIDIVGDPVTFVSQIS